MRVLVADDDAMILEVLSETLSASGHEVTCVESGREAERLLARDAFEVLITDWQMPDTNGLDLCQTVRSYTNERYIYTIVISGRTDKDDIKSGLRAGADDYLCKPIDPQELLLRLEVARRMISRGSPHIAVFAMAKLAESRDPDTGRHLERIRSYSWLLARRLAQDFPEIDDVFLDNLYHTSPLHDIGKVGVPDCILLKPDRLTDAEFEVMKSHTTLGAETLEAALEQYPETPYFEMAREITLTHHENHDGTGYPRGLIGSQIPLSGRIVRVVDVYDAVTSQRPYKKAFEHHVATGIILNHQEHFDPMILAAFFDVEDQVLAMRDVLQEGDRPRVARR